MSERSRVLLCPRPTYRAGHATASHTPGPWFIDGPQIRDAHGWALASVPDALGDATDHANARLIAAAPDLAAAALALLQRIDAMTTAAFAMGAERPERERLRATLAAALGVEADWLPPAGDAPRPDLLAALGGLVAAVQRGGPLAAAMQAAGEAIRGALAPTPAYLPIGAPVWYWLRDGAGQWVAATVTGIGGKDGLDVYDVDAGPHGGRWGWTWQVLPRPDDAPPEQSTALPPAPNLALTWP